MKVTKRTILYLCLCAGIILISLFLVTLLSGFRYEYKKFKQFILTLVVTLFIRYTFLEHIAFVIQAVIVTLKGQKERFVHQSQEGNVERENNDNVSNTMISLKLRLKSLKSELSLAQRHKDEGLNIKYKQLTEELWLFGKYFFLLLLLIIYSRNTYGYYNTATMRRILNESYFTNYKIDKLATINNLYYWINDTLTAALNEGYDYDGRAIDEPGWVHFHISKLLGVVRLQQVRHAKKEKSMTSLKFDDEDYLPKWQKLNHSMPYINKYWRIYFPWRSKHYEGVSSWLMAFRNLASIYTYTENKGYETILTRDRRNSWKILSFLKDNNWLDSRTAAVFIDFTLYNADSNMFTICSILVEQTPFGNLVWQINVQSAELLWNMNEISKWWWLLIVLYTLQVLQFCKVLVIRSWFMPRFFKSGWNCADFAIVLLNIILLLVVIGREYYVLHVIKTFVLAKKLEYVDFNVACLFNYMAIVILGFLICLASIRIWKILQFSSIFRIFNRTLYTSTIPLISTILGIHLFLTAIGLSAKIFNGSQTENFSSYLKSVTSIMSFSFGFNSRTSPNDLSHGGGVLGFILYLILMFVVAIFLVNMFTTLICDHFANAREERDQQSPDKLTYWQFLMMENSFIKEYFVRFFPSFQERQNQTVSAVINEHIDNLEKKLQDQQLMENSRLRDITEDQIFDADIQRADRIQNIAAALNLQMEILHRLIMVNSLECDSDSGDSD